METLHLKNQLINSGLAAASALVFVSPITAAAAGVTSLVLSRLAGEQTESTWLPLTLRSWEEIKEIWTTYGPELIKTQVIIGLVFMILGIGLNQTALHWIRASAAQIATLAAAFFRVCIVAPLVEETLFRGFIMDKIHNVQSLLYGAKAAMEETHALTRNFLQATAFGLCHYHPVQKLTNYFIVFVTYALGFHAGSLKEKSGSISPGLAGHALLNTSVFSRVVIFGA